MTDPCPECGETRSTEYLLAVHVAKHRYRIANSYSGRKIVCWCGLTLGGYATQALAHHLKRRGGATAHYLECKLGVEDA